jgi:hypothetical protein
VAVAFVGGDDTIHGGDDIADAATLFTVVIP